VRSEEVQILKLTVM